MERMYYHSDKKGIEAIKDYLEHDPGVTFDMEKLATTWIQTYDLYPHVYTYVISSETVGEQEGHYYICALYKIPHERYYYVSPRTYENREEAEALAEVLAKNYINFAFMDDFLKTLVEKGK
jgi:hypothetical protein